MMSGFDTTREVEMSEPTDVALAPHHDSYQSWTSTWYGPDRKPNGKLRRHTARFGKEDEVTAKQARAAFRRWLEKTWRPRYSRAVGDETGKSYTVADLAKDYWAYAQKVYKKNGKGTTHLGQVKRAMEQLGDAYGDDVTTDLTNPMLAKLRDRMLDASGWEKVAWKSRGGYGNRTGKGKEQRERERIWFSPNCINPETERTLWCPAPEVA